MKRLMSLIKDPTTTEEHKSVVLEQLQEYIEDIDNSNVLLHIDGIPTMVDLLQSNSRILRYWGSWIIATIAQNNPKGQENAIRNGALSPLLEIIRNETDDHVLAKAMSAVSALLRDNKEVQAALHLGQVYSLLKNVLEAETLIGKTKMRAVVILKHLCISNPTCGTTLGQHNILPLLAKFVSCDHDGLREQSLETLSVLIRDAAMSDKKGPVIYQMNQVGLKHRVELCKREIEKLSDEDFDARINELDLCNSVLEVL
jgi:hypothetical protein